MTLRQKGERPDGDDMSDRRRRASENMRNGSQPLYREGFCTRYPYIRAIYVLDKIVGKRVEGIDEA